MSLSREDLRREIKVIIDDGDPANLTSKKVRLTLEETLKVDLSSRKKEVDDLLMEVITSMENGGESEDDDDDDTKPPPKKLAAAAKKRSKSNASDSSSDDDDAKLAQKLQDAEKRPKRRAAKPTKKDATAAKKPRKGTSTYSVACDLSPELAEIMGSDKMARSAVVKKMWQIIKERNLKDPRDGRYHICDDQLLTVFKRKRVQSFAMMKYLKEHITQPKKT
ncbi:PREDICTED: upstream activation factor subunit spp27-like [Priapulus caudatus]|uniref:Upstream activation factor subunit spp27-like n=1 Tax=Priapulus caudatus TaxID=37621 RepID=A0ABM1DZ86_PRICU|nr:PREDICTED: upstream activation factor subunit spp27-like [Priapulus caudatus]